MFTAEQEALVLSSNVLFQGPKDGAVPPTCMNGHLKLKNNSGHHVSTLGFKGQVIGLKHVLRSVRTKHEFFTCGIDDMCRSKHYAARLRQRGLDLNN